MPSNGIPPGDGVGLALLDLPSELARRGFDSIQLCHFYLPSLDNTYLQEFRAALDDADVALECFLIDDGDLTHSSQAAQNERWLSGWLEVAEQLGAPRARVPAGFAAPSAAAITASAAALRRLAADHTEVRVVTENWHELLPNADSVLALLAETGDDVGFLIDLGNWRGVDKYDELARVAPFAETCQAKGHLVDGTLDVEDYRRSLQVLRDANYAGPLAMVYDGADPDEWTWLEREYEVVSEVFGVPARA